MAILRIHVIRFCSFNTFRRNFSRFVSFAHLPDICKIGPFWQNFIHFTDFWQKSCETFKDIILIVSLNFGKILSNHSRNIFGPKVSAEPILQNKNNILLMSNKYKSFYCQLYALSVERGSKRSSKGLDSCLPCRLLTQHPRVSIRGIPEKLLRCCRDLSTVQVRRNWRESSKCLLNPCSTGEWQASTTKQLLKL